MKAFTFYTFCFLIADRIGEADCMVIEGDNQTWLCLAEAAERAIQEQRWRRVAIIYDRQSISVIPTLEEVKRVAYQIDDDTSFAHVLQEIHKILFPETNVVVVLHSTTVLAKLIHEADCFDAKANHSTDFSHHSKWLVFTKDVSIFLSGTLIVENLQNVALLTDIFQPNVCSVETHSLRRVLGGSRFLPVDTTMPVPLRMFPNTQFGYNGRSLRVSAVASLPFVISDVGKEGIPYKGLCIEVLDIITKLLNVTATYVEPQDGTWGWIDNGMIGQLKRRELDLIASDIVFHAERALHVDYITPYLYSDERVFAYKMSPATQPIFLLAGPLKPTVYLVHVAVGFLVIIIIILMETFGRLNSTRPRTGACNLLWELFKPSFKQGLSLYILNTPGRLLLIFWWLLVMLISALYCGNLTATLAANTNLRKFRSIDELVESDFSMGFMKGGIMPQLLKNSPRGDIKRLYQKFLRLNESDPRLTSNNKAFLVQRVMDGHYAFAVHKSMVEQLLEGDCTLSMLHFGDRTKTPLSFVVQKNSPFKDDIEEVMQQLDSSGLLRQMWKKWNNQTKSRTCNRSRSNVRVTTAEVVGAVIVPSTGIGLASLSLLLERVAARWKQT